MKHLLKLGLVLLCLIISLPAAQAQGTCTMETMSGTYAFKVMGASTAVFGPSTPPFILHWDAKTAPLALAGMITLQKDGTGQGFWWQINGTANGGLTTVAFTLTTPELNPDCTGIFEYTYQFAGQTHTNREWFVGLENGRELRSVSMEGGLPTGAWHTTAHRLKKGVAPVRNFSQGNMKGDYLFVVESLFPVNSPPFLAFNGEGLMRVRIAENGDFTGVWRGKEGPQTAASDVSGHVTVNPDGTIEGTLNVAAAPGITNISRGVLYDGGKRGYLIPLVNLLDGGGSFQQIYGVAEIVRIGP